MAHEIYTLADGRSSIGYVGNTPWHGLGQQIPADAPLEIWAKEAGLDWEVLTGTPQYINQKGHVFTIPSKKALYRSDDGGFLSIMGAGYNIVQPATILEFYRNLINTAGFRMNTAGSVFGGKKIWALAEIGKSATIKGDTLNGFLLLSTSCDGSLATTAQFTTVRVVCNNTLTMAVNSTENKYAVKVPHCRQFNAEEVKEELGLVNNAWGTFEDQITSMMDRRLTRRSAVLALIRALGDDTLPIDDQPNVKTLAKIMDLFDGKGIGSDMVSAKGTAWGLLNAVTQYADHDRVTRSTDSRLDSSWWGSWEMNKRKMFDECLKLAA